METPDVVLDELRSVLRDAGDIPLSCWNREELADWLCGLQDIRAQIDGLLCTAAAEGQAAALFQLDRARSLRQFVALRTGTKPADVGADLALGTWLAAFPAVSRALTAGRITRRHAQTLRELDNPRTHRHLLAGIDYLVDTAAADITWDDFIDICHRWLANADPDGTLPDERTRKRRCSLNKRADGTLGGQFDLDTIEGDAVRNAIEREALRLFRIDADPTNPEARVRNHAQRMADALVNLITRGAIRKDGTVGAPLVHVVVGLDVLEEAMCRKAAADAGVAADRTRRSPSRRRAADRPHEPAAALRARRRHPHPPQPGVGPARCRHHPHDSCSTPTERSSTSDAAAATSPAT